MCNLNFLIKGGIVEPQSDLLNAYNSACFNSFIQNNDNEGFYFDYKNSIITSEEKINLFDNKVLFENSRFILGHQRFTTSGTGLNYAQPFKKGDFVFFHNGILSEYAHNQHSDTFNLFEAFLKHFARYSKKFKRETAIKKAIEKILKNKFGSFSIGIFDIKKQSLFYFKNDRTSINAIIDNKKELLYLSTAQHNINFLEVYNPTFKEIEIKDDTLYLIEISKRGKISLKSKGSLNFNIAKNKEKFEELNFKKAEIVEQQSDLLNLDFFKHEEKIKFSLTPLKCEYCGEKTNNTKGEYYGVFCDNCLIEMEDLSEDTNNKLLREYIK